MCVFCAFFVLERNWTGWRLPTVATWWPRVLLVNAVQLGVVLTRRHHVGEVALVLLPLPLGTLSPFVGGAIATFIATFIFYW
jgi:hypothetical protein